MSRRDLMHLQYFLLVGSATIVLLGAIGVLAGEHGWAYWAIGAGGLGVLACANAIRVLRRLPLSG